MAVAGVRYTYQQAPWNAPLSLGVQALIEYNGLVINDRYQSDRIRVYSITGLDGPDITDVRESIPGDEGEFVYPSLYRGRTFVLTGAIQAGSLATSTQMGETLRSAYSPLVEAPMRFRWFDIYDGFDWPDTLGNYTAVVGASAAQDLVVSGGVLPWATTEEVVLMRSADNRLWGDVQVTERLVVGSPNDGSQFSVILTMTDANDYLAVTLDNVDDGDGAELLIQTVVGDTQYALDTQTIGTLVQGSSVWLRGRREGDMVTAELWLEEPSDTTFPDYVAQTWLEGSDADAFGDQVLSEVGLAGEATNTYWAVDDFQVEALYPSDIAFPVKTITKPSISDAQQQKDVFQRQFQLTLRAGWPYAQGRAQRRSRTLYPASGNTTVLGFSNPLTNPLSALSIIPGTVSLENNILSFQNRGTAPVRPIIVFFGATGAFQIYSLTNEMSLTWDNVLADGDYLVFDCQARTLVDGTGANQLGSLTISDPRWMRLEPGWNDLYVNGSNYSDNTRVALFTHDGWV